MRDDPCRECNIHQMCIADTHAPCEIRKQLEQLREFRNNLPVLVCEHCNKTFLACAWIQFKDGHHGPFFLKESIVYCPFCGKSSDTPSKIPPDWQFPDGKTSTVQEK